VKWHRASLLVSVVAIALSGSHMFMQIRVWSDRGLDSYWYTLSGVARSDDPWVFTCGEPGDEFGWFLENGNPVLIVTCRCVEGGEVTVNATYQGGESQGAFIGGQRQVVAEAEGERFRVGELLWPVGCQLTVKIEDCDCEGTASLFGWDLSRGEGFVVGRFINNAVAFVGLVGVVGVLLVALMGFRRSENPTLAP